MDFVYRCCNNIHQKTCKQYVQCYIIYIFVIGIDFRRQSQNCPAQSIAKTAHDRIKYAHIHGSMHISFYFFYWLLMYVLILMILYYCPGAIKYTGKTPICIQLFTFICLFIMCISNTYIYIQYAYRHEQSILKT